MVVELPKDETLAANWCNDPIFKPDYGQAVDVINEMLDAEGKAPVKISRGQVPFRVSLSDRDVELWAVSRDLENKK